MDAAPECRVLREDDLDLAQLDESIDALGPRASSGRCEKLEAKVEADSVCNKKQMQ